MEKEITIEIKNPWSLLLAFALLAILMFFFIKELQVMYSTHINFGDEGFHTKIAQTIAEEIKYPVWTPFGLKTSRGAWGSPPVWHLTAAFFFFVFKNVDTIAKFLPPFVALISGFAIFVLVKRIFNEKTAFLVSIIFLSLPSFVTYAVLFYRDMIFVLYLTLFFLTFILHFKTGRKKYWILSAVFSFLAFLSKTPGVAVYLFVVLVFLYQLIWERKKFTNLLKKYSVFIVFLIILAGPYFLRNFYYYKTPLCHVPLPLFDRSGCHKGYYESKLKFSGRTEEVGTEVNLLKYGFANYLEFAYGPIWFVTLAFFCGLLLLFLKKDKVNLIIFFILLMLVPIFYRSTGRTEDTARYTLGWAPIITLVAAKWLSEVPTLPGVFFDFLKKYVKYFALVIFISVIWLSYVNFSGKLAIMGQVKQFSPLYFEACEWVKNNLLKNVTLLTIWSNRAVYNTQRNCVGNLPDIALSRELNHTLKVAKENGITHLFIQKFSIDFQNRHLSEKYDYDFVEFLENNPEHFVKVYENGPSLEQCRQQGGCDGNIIYEIKY